ncbi:MAG: c-type cytochrome [Candidatus Brocadiales bacterium]
MMKSSRLFLLVAVTTLLFWGLQGAKAGAGKTRPEVRYLGTMPCTESLPPSEKGARLFKLCDGETKVIIAADGIEPGKPMPRSTAQKVANTMLVAYEELKTSKLLAHKGVPHTRRDLMTFRSELKRVIQKGYDLFHSPELGTNGISCDMCHPDASNNHPETYPKFQTQLKKVALLRDMINWCIENPLEGEKLDDSDERMKVLEAYLLSARKGTPLEFGKH